MKKIPRVALSIESTASYGRELIRGVVKYSNMHGPWFFPWVFYNDDIRLSERMQQYVHLDYLKRWRPDGIITRNAENISELAKLNIPLFVAAGANSPNPNWNTIVTDDFAIGTMAAEHLLERGFHNFAFCGFDYLAWSRGRCESFCKKITEAGFKTNVFEQSQSRVVRDWDKEEIILIKWLQTLPKPAGVMVCNDRRGQHVAEACAKANLEVPYEIAIIGVDNDDFVCNITNPQLSSVALDIEWGGYRACKLLDKMMSGKKMPPQTVIVRPIKVVTRQSTNTVAVEDKLVAQALHFINQNAARPLQIYDVMKALNVSRSYLHQKFMNTLKRSVYDEIKRARINLICRLLLETDLPATDIAVKLGFTDDSHISRYFKQKMGMSPLKYRKLMSHK